MSNKLFWTAFLYLHWFRRSRCGYIISRNQWERQSFFFGATKYYVYPGYLLINGYHSLMEITFYRIFYVGFIIECFFKGKVPYYCVAQVIDSLRTPPLVNFYINFRELIGTISLRTDFSFREKAKRIEQEVQNSAHVLWRWNSRFDQITQRYLRNSIFMFFYWTLLFIYRLVERLETFPSLKIRVDEFYGLDLFGPPNFFKLNDVFSLIFNCLL